MEQHEDSPVASVPTIPKTGAADTNVVSPAVAAVPLMSPPAAPPSTSTGIVPTAPTLSSASTVPTASPSLPYTWTQPSVPSNSRPAPPGIADSPRGTPPATVVVPLHRGSSGTARSIRNVGEFGSPVLSDPRITANPYTQDTSSLSSPAVVSPQSLPYPQGAGGAGGSVGPLAQPFAPIAPPPRAQPAPVPLTGEDTVTTQPQEEEESVPQAHTDELQSFASYFTHHSGLYSARTHTQLGRAIRFALDLESFRGADLKTVGDVLVVHALDRIVGAIDWFCEWPSCRETLANHLTLIRFVHASERGHSFEDHHGSTAIVFQDSFAGSHSGFPLANAVAHVMDEYFQLYKLRVHDIRYNIMPPYEARLRQVLGNRCDLRLNIENFGRLDWEEDNFYNTYLELAPSNSERFFGRIVSAIERCCQTTTGYKKCHDAIQIIEIKLSLKAYKRIHLKSRRLKLSERFWNGIEHDRAQILEYLTKTLDLGTDVVGRVNDLATRIVPYWEERIRRCLGLPMGRRVVIDIVWPSFQQALVFEKAVNTLYHRRSAYVLERIWGALQDIVDRYPASISVVRDALHCIRVQHVSDTSTGHQGQITAAGGAGAAGTHALVPREVGASQVRDGNSRVSASLLLLPSSTGRSNRLTLEVKVPFELGERACFSQDFIHQTLVKGFQLRPALPADAIQVSAIKQTHHSVEVSGHVTTPDTFLAIYDMMEEHQTDMRRLGHAQDWLM